MIHDQYVAGFSGVPEQSARQDGMPDASCRRAAECQAQRLDAARDGRQAPSCTCFPQQGERRYC